MLNIKLCYQFWNILKRRNAYVTITCPWLLIVLIQSYHQRQFFFYRHLHANICRHKCFINKRKYKIAKNKLAIKAVDLLGISLEFSFVSQGFVYNSCWHTPDLRKCLECTWWNNPSPSTSLSWVPAGGEVWRARHVRWVTFQWDFYFSQRMIALCWWLSYFWVV